MSTEADPPQGEMLAGFPAVEVAPAPALPESRPIGFRDVPWSWKDLLIGLAPLVGLRLLSPWVNSLRLPEPIAWLLLALNLFSMVWMLGYPLWILRRRHA